MLLQDSEVIPAAIAYVSIGVADIAQARQFWVGQLGLEIVTERIGPDPALARLWNLSAAQIAAQMVLRTPGAATGWLHFVQFREPGDAVRHGAQSFDLCAKNIDVNCVDLPARVATLRKAGYRFRSEPVEYEVGGIHAREVQLAGHDGVNIVFIEVLTTGYELAWSPEGFAALTSFVVIVPDALAEARFYQALLGLDELMHHRISGPGIEAAVGLPAGSVLDMRLVGRADRMFGRMELIQYEGLQGQNLFPRAVPPATGILGCAYEVPSINGAMQYAGEHDLELTDSMWLELLTGVGEVRVMHSPAGLRLELWCRTDGNPGVEAARRRR